MSQLLQDWVTARAARQPDAVAVVGPEGTLTYGELETFSNQLARMLKEGGCLQGDRVCLLTPKSPTAIAAILGIYKADCLYVPLDPSTPAARLAKIIRACENRWILAAGPTSALLGALSDAGQCGRAVSIGWLDPEPARAAHFRTEFTLDDVRTYPSTPLEYENTTESAAHILFTSGSTGTPKGVVITHANVIRFIAWATTYFGLSDADRISAHSPLHFDLSMLDIFGAFAAGAELHVVPPELNVLPNKLAEFIRRSELTQWFSVPSVLEYMAHFDVVTSNDFPALKRLMWCGDVLSTPSLIYWMARLPHVAFTNLYGPTETTIASSYYTVRKCPDDPRAAIPIGTACPGEELLVLNEALQPAPPGEAGDLYIRGVGLSPGYWRDPDKTRAAFVPYPQGGDPSDRIYKTGDLAKTGDAGVVYFLGRVDSQIKSRGYRIELGEIEAALNAMGWLQECAVVAISSDGFEGAIICCAFVPLPGRDVTPPALRQELSKFVPAYMLPARWLALDRLPKNANGKTDRRELKEAFQRHEAETDRQHRAHSTRRRMDVRQGELPVARLR